MRNSRGHPHHAHAHTRFPGPPNPVSGRPQFAAHSDSRPTLPAPGSDARRLRRLGGAPTQPGGLRVAAAAAEQLAGRAPARNAPSARPAGSGPTTRAAAAATAACGGGEGGARGAPAGDAGGCGHPAGSARPPPPSPAPPRGSQRPPRRPRTPGVRRRRAERSIALEAETHGEPRARPR